ncbi:MAG: hydrogenase expression/formation protein HypE [Clostridiales bacterium]|nr:hydrogenase expression/formation protein HypE [Clostridiales bacterium]
MEITMAHGSGGRASAELMARVFGKYFRNDILDRMEDSAVLEACGKIAFSTDSFVVSPPVFAGGDIGKLSICGTVNDLLMMGAVPEYIACGFILEEGLDIALLEKVVESMANTANEAGVKIVAGDTKVVEGRGGLYINTSGLGRIPEGRNVSAANIKDGDIVLLSGNLGDHHACVLSARMGIRSSIKSDCACLGDITKALFEGGVCVSAMRDVTRGGIGTVLNELAEASGCGIELDESEIPISSEVKGFCSILGLDPLYMGNEGKMVAFVPQQDAEKALALVKSTGNGKNAAAIGKAVKGKGVVIKTRLGGTRIVDVLQGEGLPRIC